MTFSDPDHITWLRSVMLNLQYLQLVMLEKFLQPCQKLGFLVTRGRMGLFDLVISKKKNPYIMLTLLLQFEIYEKDF